MPEAFRRLQQQAIELWKDMDASQKTRVIFIGALVIISISIGIFMITRPSYENLFSSRLDQKEIGEISKVLKDNKFDYKVVDGGTGIQVRNKDLDQAQLILSQEGYPKSGTTFKDALNSIKLSTTESDKKKIFKEYSEQKIARGLGTIDNITSAVVNLSLPEKDVFLGDSKQQEPTASVLIEASEPLTKQQLRGIENFVAGSVEGLNRKNVMIVDKSSGNMLNDTEEDALVASTTKQYEFQTALKKEIEGKVEGLLGGMYDGVRVAANVVCDFNTEKSNEVKYTPVVGEDSGILRSTETHKEEVQNGGSGGVPGTDSNTGGTTTPSYPTDSSSGSSYKKTDSVTNYEVNQKNTESEKAVGQMDKEKSSITVSLIYGTKKTTPPAQADIDTYTKMISNATGIATGNITLASFKLPAAQPEKPKFDWLGLLGKAVPVLILAVLLVLLGIGIVRQNNISEPGLAFGGGYSKAASNSIMIEEEQLPDIELEEKSEVKKQIDKFVKHKPEAVAQLLRNWLSDEWD